MRSNRVPRYVLGSLLAILCLALPMAPRAIAQPIPLPGLEGDALVVYDTNGIPHICSGSDRDTILTLGYVHAQDRFFQMDTLRRTFTGNLAELVGVGAVASDVQFRTLGLRRAAEESLGAYAAAGLTETLEQLDAYAQGVNQYLATHPLPPEYGALELTQAAPWTPVDSLVIGKGLSFGLSFDLFDIELTIQAAAYAQAGAIGGFDGLALLFEDTSRTAPFDPTVSIPSSSSIAPAPSIASQRGAPGRGSKLAVPDKRTAELARSYREKVSGIPLLETAFRRSEVGAGSNWWILAGDKTESGFPMLASDPHLGLDTPATWYEVHLISSSEPGCGLDGSSAAFRPGDGGRGGKSATKTGLDVNGVSIAGAPGVTLGCNQEICWGATVHPMDVTDVYQEVLVLDPATGLPTHTLFEGQLEPVVLIPQKYLFNQPGDGVPDNLADAGVGPLDGGVTVIIPRRNNGPIVNIDASQLPVTALSIQYTGWRGTLELEAFRRFQRASSVAEFQDALQYFDVGSQNFSYADVHGNIAYFTSAEMPIREDLQNLGFPAGGIPPYLIRDGTHTLPHEWLAVQNPQPQQALGFEILPFAEMPQVVNPAKGYVINANNDPIGTSLDNDPLNQQRPGGGIFYLSPGYASLRVGRIGRLMEALLAGGNKATLDDMKAMQANNQLLDAELVAPFVIGAFANAADPGAPAELQALAADPGVAEAVTRLMAWDFSTPTGIAAGYDPGDDPANLPQPSAQEIAKSVAATIWSVLRALLIQDVIYNALIGVGLGDYLPSPNLAYAALAHHLFNYDANQGIGASGVDFLNTFFNLNREQSRDFILLTNLRAALDLLASDEFSPAFDNSTDQDDYRWGYLHRLELDHLLGGPFSIPPAGGFNPLAADLPGLSRAGGYEAVDASSHSARADGINEFMFGSGASRRLVGVLDPAGVQAEQILPGGQSGVLGSPHYASQLGRWLTNDYHPLLLAPPDVAGDAVTQQKFTPSCAANLTLANQTLYGTQIHQATGTVTLGPDLIVSNGANVTLEAPMVAFLTGTEIRGVLSATNNPTCP